MHIFKDTNYNFLRWRWYALGLSWAVVLAGLFVILTKGIPLGVEFAGGTVVVTQFEQPVSVEQVRGAMTSAFPGVETVVQEYGKPGERQVMVRVPLVGEESGAALSKARDQITSALKQGGLGNFTIIGSEIVGPIVGQELTRKGIWATVLSMVAILLYIGVRFQLSFGVGAIVATLHDLLVTVAFLAFFQYDLTLNVIAAILTITGFSTNDTIVIFDRVRENARAMRRDGLNEVINRSINQTLGRTIITAGTALMSALALFLFGGEVLRGFAFTMVVGIITGTYSTVFIAAAIVSFWRGGGRTQQVTASPAAPVPQASGRSKNRKARAS
ncbi:MAG TPA: protein translocase subunit SecF [Vicinamibacterales bacterium]